MSFHLSTSTIHGLPQKYGYIRAVFEYEGSKKKIFPMKPCRGELGDRIADYIQTQSRFPMKASMFDCFDDPDDEIYL